MRGWSAQERLRGKESSSRPGAAESVKQRISGGDVEEVRPHSRKARRVFYAPAKEGFQSNRGDVEERRPQKEIRRRFVHAKGLHRQDKTTSFLLRCGIYKGGTKRRHFNDRPGQPMAMQEVGEKTRQASRRKGKRKGTKHTRQNVTSSHRPLTFLLVSKIYQYSK